MISTHGYVAGSPPLGAADTGGQVVYVLEVSKKLAQLGHEVDIWTRRFDGQDVLEKVNERVRVIRMRCGGDRFIKKEVLSEHLDEWVEHAVEFVRRHRLNYRFVDSHYWDGGVAGVSFGRILGAPHVHTPHSLGLWKQQQMEQDRPGDRSGFEREYNFARRIEEERRVYAESSLLVATTPQQFDLLVKDYGVAAEKVRMVPPGYDDSRFFPVSEASRDAIRKRLGFDGPVVLALGRLARNKGYDLLIDAFGLVVEREPRATLYLAVGGAEMNPEETALLAELKEAAGRTPYAARIRFGSFVPDADLPDYYRAADVFALSSRYEPFGMTAIEAMASGTPTVVTVHGGLYRALSFGRHALFAEPLDKADLGIMMATVFRHPRLRKRLATMGAHKARSLFTWTGVAQQLIAAVVEGPKAPAGFEDNDWDEPWNDGD
jgi:mannosylfructose-phosphate synthase